MRSFSDIVVVPWQATCPPLFRGGPIWSRPATWVTDLTDDMGDRSSCRRGGPCRCPGRRPVSWTSGAFVLAVEAGEEPMAAVCRRFGISRQHGYKWLERWRAEGVAGLADRSRAPLNHPQAVAAELARGGAGGAAGASDLGAGEGARRARAAERRRLAGRPWPAASTIGGLFDREGLTVQAQAAAAGAARRAALRRRCGQRRLDHGLQGLVPHRRRHPCRPADAQRRLQPLPAALPGGGAPDTAHVWPILDAAFREYGLPLAAALATTGRPFATVGAGGLSRLAVNGDQGRASPPSASAPASRRRTAGTSGCT